MAFYGTYLNIQDSNATPGSTFLADNTCVDNGNNLGWTFNDGPFLYVDGFSATSSLGTTTVTAEVDIAATGVFATAEAGNLVVSGKAAETVTGVSATAPVGTATASAGADVSVTGEFATATSGSVTVTSSAAVIPTGVEAIGQLGTVLIYENEVIDAIGVSATAQEGDAAVTADANVYIFNNHQYLDISDCIATGEGIPFLASGSVDSGNNVNWVIETVEIGLVQGVGGVNAPTISGMANVIPTGIEATGALGLLDFSTNNYISVTGLQATGAVGSVVVTAEADFFVTGFILNGQLGNVQVSGTGNIFPQGVVGFGQTTPPLVWGKVDDLQDPNWKVVPN
jgi:hypothetical protein